MEHVAARRYTLAEIDNMREAIRKTNEANSYHPTLYQSGYWSSAGDYQAQIQAASKRVEEHLRTCMFGGVGLDELTEKQKSAEDAMQERVKAYEASMVERLLRAEYGPR